MIRARRRRRAHWPTIVAERGQVQEQEGHDQADASEEDARFEDLREAIAALPAHLRNVVLLRDLSRLPYREVGKMLGIDPATARVYRRHAVVKLAESLDQGCES
jgi:RNA polymerase sigma factor (sigma-70 family)